MWYTPVTYIAFNPHKLQGQCMKTQVIRIRVEDYNRLFQYKEESGVPITEAVHRAIEEFLKKMNTQKMLVDQLQKFDPDQLIQILREIQDTKQ